MVFKIPAPLFYSELYNIAVKGVIRQFDFTETYTNTNISVHIQLKGTAYKKKHFLCY